MGTNWGNIVREESKNSKGIGEYTKCQSTVFVYSTVLMFATTGLTYSLLQNKRFKTIPLKNRFLGSCLLGAFSSWYFARVGTKHCQELWMIIDNKVPLIIDESKEIGD